MPIYAGYGTVNRCLPNDLLRSNGINPLIRLASADIQGGLSSANIEALSFSGTHRLLLQTMTVSSYRHTFKGIKLFLWSLLHIFKYAVVPDTPDFLIFSSMREGTDYHCYLRNMTRPTAAQSRDEGIKGREQNLHAPVPGEVQNQQSTSRYTKIKCRRAAPNYHHEQRAGSFRSGASQ